MSEQKPQLGKLITGPASRDAVHVAIAPVIAKEDLYAGNRVSFVSGRPQKFGISIVKKDETNAVGIIDPFLKEPVLAGERCWVFMFPGTTTALRHEWSHPALLEDEEGWGTGQDCSNC